MASHKAPGPVAPDKTFPTVELRGGPGPTNLQALIDGVPIDKVFRMEITADQHDAVRVKIFQFAALNIDIQAVTETVYKVEINIPSVKDGERVWSRFQAEGPTLREAFEIAIAEYEAGAESVSQIN